jgi:hypothetical protein
MILGLSQDGYNACLPEEIGDERGEKREGIYVRRCVRICVRR